MSLKLRIIALFLMLISCCFAVAGQKKPKVDLAKKISEATPQSLPQSPRGDREKTDADDNNLKGKVKSVVQYSLGKKGDREIESEEYYNEGGDLVREVD